MHQKKADTRATYSSVKHIMQVFYSDLKKADPLVPSWPFLGADLLQEAASQPEGIRDVSIAGTITNDMLAKAGMVLGAAVEEKPAGKTEERRKYEIVVVLAARVELKEIKDDKKEVKDDKKAVKDDRKALQEALGEDRVIVSRADLLTKWRVVNEPKLEVHSSFARTLGASMLAIVS